MEVSDWIIMASCRTQRSNAHLHSSKNQINLDILEQSEKFSG